MLALGSSWGWLRPRSWGICKWPAGLPWCRPCQRPSPPLCNSWVRVHRLCLSKIPRMVPWPSSHFCRLSPPVETPAASAPTMRALPGSTKTSQPPQQAKWHAPFVLLFIPSVQRSSYYKNSTFHCLMSIWDGLYKAIIWVAMALVMWWWLQEIRDYGGACTHIEDMRTSWESSRLLIYFVWGLHACWSLRTNCRYVCWFVTTWTAGNYSHCFRFWAYTAFTD